MGDTIAEAATRFLRTGRPSELVATVRMVLRQGRLVEAAYGAWCFIAHRPSPIVAPDDAFDAAAAGAAGRAALAALTAEKEDLVREAARSLAPDQLPFDCTIHGFIRTERGFILGEYADRSARLCVCRGAHARVLRPYGNDPSIRHIHSILRHGEHAYVATGDGGKYLDRYRIIDCDLRFDRRVLQRLGGFTTCAVVGGRAWFGTDFSERPNYLYCLETGARHFFPRPAFTKWCFAMLPLEDRYLYCVNTRLGNLSDQRAVSIFDTRVGAFVFCKEMMRAAAEPGAN